MLLSIVLMTVDHRDNHLENLRAKLTVVISPLQYAVSWPLKTLDWMEDNLATQQALRHENQKLRGERLLLQAQVQKFIALKNENRHLRALLRSAPPSANKVLVAQLLSVSSDPFIQQLVLDKGSKQGVFQGQPVLDANGVLGQVIQVGPLTSRVLLLSDSHSAIPVQDSRNGVRAIAVGTGQQGALSLMHVPKTTPLKPGDLLVTSGLGHHFPVGFPVGTISSVQHLTGEHFATIEVIPSANMDRSRLVLLVWPGKRALKVATNELSQISSLG